MLLCEKITKKEEGISSLGLGYVGMPIDITFANKGVKVVGFDLNREKIELYKSGITLTHKVVDGAIKSFSIYVKGLHSVEKLKKLSMRYWRL